VNQHFGARPLSISLGLSLALALSFLAGTRAAVAQSMPAPDFGTPPSGEVPILFNDRHVYTKPDKLKAGRVLAALVKNGTILVPLRSLFEQTGATVTYDPATRSVDVAKPGADVKVTLGQHRVVIDGEERPLDVPPEMYRGTLVVPLRVISEGMGAYVQWLPDRRLVIVRYNPAPPTATPAPETPAPAAPPTAPPPPPKTPPPTPAPAPTYHFETFVAGDYDVTPLVYNEVSPGQHGRDSFELKGGTEFPLFGPTWMLEGHYRHTEYVHPANGTGALCTAGTAGCNTVVGNDPIYQPGLCPAPDPGCVTVVGYQNTAALNGLGQAYVPSFYAKEDDLDVRFGLKVANPRVYVGVGGFFKHYNYLGYPTVSGVGGGIDKLPDFDAPLAFYGSVWYYPTVTGNYTYPTSVFLGPLSGSTAKLSYSVLKYEVGADIGIGGTPLYIDLGYGGDQFHAKTNAPSNTAVTAPFAGLGLHF
jgi:hypothetical protein